MNSGLNGSEREYSWEVEINLQYLKTLFTHIIETNSEIKFEELCDLLKNCNKVIDKLLKNSHKIANEKIQILQERVSIGSTISKESSKHIINELMGYINKLFTVPFCYILYSSQFRELFELTMIFKVKSKKLSVEEYEENFIQNSNKSILENLLN